MFYYIIIICNVLLAKFKKEKTKLKNERWNIDIYSVERILVSVLYYETSMDQWLERQFINDQT